MKLSPSKKLQKAKNCVLKDLKNIKVLKKRSFKYGSSLVRNSHFQCIMNFST